MFTRECSAPSCDDGIVVFRARLLLAEDDPEAKFSEEALALDEIIKCWAINSKSCSLRSAKLIPIAVAVDAEVEGAGRCAACQGHHQPGETGLTTLSGTKWSGFAGMSFKDDA
jgi:hypothetical protein